MNTFLKDLQDRGLIHQSTDLEELSKTLDEGPISLYCGFDATADSLHIGHLLPMLMLRRFQEAGHRPVALVGGGTGLIGDPSGRSEERTLNPASTVQGWTDKLKQQISKVVKFDDGAQPAKLVNNYDWLGGLEVITFLRDVGKHFSINYMLAKDSVSTRLEKGLSFTEFTYMMLQSYDYLNLYDQEKCRLQIGGSDQWGNITAGIELIRRSIGKTDVHGFTMPLITKSDGTKFGKTAGGAVWLDGTKTSPYEFYQFWLNTDDRDAIKFLKCFTFLSLETIASIQEEFDNAPEERKAQKVLAEEMTKLVHGEEALQQAIHISNALFGGGDLKTLSSEEIRQGFKDVPSSQWAKEEMSLVDMLVEAGISPSKRQAREDIQNGAIYINGERRTEVQTVLGEADKLDGTYVIVRRGKKKYHLIEWV
ncbi:tyrosine--tRNA ligase [Bacillaceae bacterium SIJ1]|uniref:tyrosine--tRNA ligase n=1 Tax=Litoribacterium kuwaitense TaxID=1398745 RepID=UPI0013ED0406|nr:tyrosine--tRNA ligase [Litoribacterium kuwaitense]NGP44194.1 tyrosine--tRNA ligase [Litoribacterium kuwaitense]